MSTDARLLHRLLGLTVVKVSTGQEARGDAEFALDAVRSGDVPGAAGDPARRLAAPAGRRRRPAPPTGLLARWQPSWLRYSPLSFTGLAMIAAAVGRGLPDGSCCGTAGFALAREGLDAAERVGVVVTVVAGRRRGPGALGAAVGRAVARDVRQPGAVRATKAPGVLHLEHGLLRVREHTYDMRRLRGGTIREPLLVRMFGGARLDAVMTGVDGAGEASLLLPPCPAATAEAVLTELIGRPDVVSGELRGARSGRDPSALDAGADAARRCWPSAGGGGVRRRRYRRGRGCLCGAGRCRGAFLAADRSRALGHRVGDGWLVARAGSLDRRRDCIAAAGIIGWTVRQTLFQRRAGVATLIAATAAGVKGYRVLDVPAELAWSIAAAASPWVADNDLGSRS